MPPASTTTRHKTVDAQFKADPTGGSFTAIISVFGNIDAYGDVVVAGAFAESLAEWAALGDPIPCIFAHTWGDPDYHIGVLVEAKELLPGDPLLPEALKDFGGLWVRGELDDDPPPSKAQKVRRLLKGRRVKKFSFAYDILDAGWAERDGRSVYELRKLALLEGGPCLVGVNDATDLIDAKHDKPAAGGAGLTADELAAMKTARDAFDRVLSRVATPATESEPPAHPAAKAHPASLSRADADLALLEL